MYSKYNFTKASIINIAVIIIIIIIILVKNLLKFVLSYSIFIHILNQYKIIILQKSTSCGRRKKSALYIHHILSTLIIIIIIFCHYGRKTGLICEFHLLRTFVKIAYKILINRHLTLFIYKYR